jgi:hypothetical protein
MRQQYTTKWLFAHLYLAEKHRKDQPGDDEIGDTPPHVD